MEPSTKPLSAFSASNFRRGHVDTLMACPPAGGSRLVVLFSLGFVLALAIDACGDDGGSASSSKCGLEGDARCRPDRERVDRAKPVFSHPTNITRAVASPTTSGRGSRARTARPARSCRPAGIFAAAEARDWRAASATLATITAAVRRFPDVVAVPRSLDEQLNDALGALGHATGARAPADARQAAVDVAGLDVRAQQVLVDAAAADQAAVASDVAILETIRDRIRGTVDATGQIDAVLGRLWRAADDKDVAAVAAAVPTRRDALAGL